jgi:hypothetical protein
VAIGETLWWYDPTPIPRGHINVDGSLKDSPGMDAKKWATLARKWKLKEKGMLTMDVVLQSIGVDTAEFDFMIVGQRKGGSFFSAKSKVSTVQFFFRLPKLLASNQLKETMLHSLVGGLQQAAVLGSHASAPPWVDEGMHPPSTTPPQLQRPSLVIESTHLPKEDGSDAAQCPVDLTYWKFLGGKFEQEREVERIQVLLRWLIKEMVKKEVDAVNNIEQNTPALQKMRAQAAELGNADSIDTSAAERELLLFIQSKDLTLLEAAACLFRIYPLFSGAAVQAMDRMKIPLLNQISQMSKLQAEINTTNDKGDFSKLCVRGLAMPLFHFTAAETLRTKGLRPIIGNGSGSHATQVSTSPPRPSCLLFHRQRQYFQECKAMERK